jgi:hypothetical protein
VHHSIFIFKRYAIKKIKKEKKRKGKKEKKLISACISFLRYIPELVH